MATEPDISIPPPYIDPREWPTILEHRRRYLASGGTEGHILGGHRTLLITTTGRRTGLPRTNGLIYGQDGDAFLVVASLHGAPRAPQWYLNLTADPHVTVQVATDRFAATARTADEQERPRLWEIMTGIYPTYARYEAHSVRTLPVVVLERAPGA